MEYFCKSALLLWLLPVFSFAQSSYKQGFATIKRDTIPKVYTRTYHEDSKINFFAAAALNISNTSSSPASPYTAAGGGSYTSYLPAVSLGVNFINNPNVGRLQFRLELSVAGSQYRSSFQDKVSPYVAVESTFNQLDISFAPQIIYNFYNASNFKIYAGAGAFLTYSKYSDIYYGSQNRNAPGAIFDRTNPYDFNYFNNTLLLIAGFQFNKKWEVFGKYLVPVATAKGGYFDLTDKREQIGVICFFGK
jgi:hypothetical protein